jgi:hypothetical protein
MFLSVDISKSKMNKKISILLINIFLLNLNKVIGGDFFKKLNDCALTQNKIIEAVHSNYNSQLEQIYSQLKQIDFLKKQLIIKDNEILKRKRQLKYSVSTLFCNEIKIDKNFGNGNLDQEIDYFETEDIEGILQAIEWKEEDSIKWEQEQC